MANPDPPQNPGSAARPTADPLDYNAVLSRISLEAGPASEGLSLLTRVARRPLDPVGAGRACAGANAAVAAALGFLHQPVEAARARGAQLHALDARLTAELGVSRTGEHIGSRGRRLTNFPAWGMCIALGAVDVTQAGLIAGGLLILWAAHIGRPIPIAQARAVMREGTKSELTPEDLRALLDSDQDVADTQFPRLAALQRRWPEIRNALASPP